MTRLRTRTAAMVLAALTLTLMASACDPQTDLITFAGTGIAGYSGDGGHSLKAQLNAPGDTSAIPSRGYYVLDGGNCVIRKVDPNDSVSTVAGQAGSCGYSGDGGPATQATIKPYLDTSSPGDGGGLLALGADGDLFFVDTANARIRKVAPDGIITTVVETGGAVIHLTTDPFHNVYFAAQTHGAGGPLSGVYGIQADDTVVEVLPMAAGANWDGLAVGAGGDLYWVVKRHTRTGIYRDVVRHTATGEEATGISERGAIVDLAVSIDGTVYAATTTGVVRAPAGGPAATIAGTGSPDPATGLQPSGDPLAASLSPNGIELTPAHGILISSGHAVYRIPQP